MKLELPNDYLQEATGYYWDNIPWLVLHELCRSSIYWFLFFCQFRPHSEQKKIVDPFEAGCHRVAAKSGQGPGKSAVTSLISMAWGVEMPESKIMVTAPSMKHVRDIYLPECRKWHRQAHPHLQTFIEITKSKIVFGGDPNWLCLPVTAAGGNVVGLQGHHADNMHVIIEEASGLTPALWETVIGTASNTKSEYTPNAELCRILAVGNPNKVNTPFYDCFHTLRGDGRLDGEGGWFCVTLRADKSPTVSKENIEQIKKIYGEDSDAYRVRVLGEFPEKDARGIISMSDLEACAKSMDKTRWQVLQRGKGKQFGIDIARQGGDESTVFIRQGGSIIDMKIFPRTSVFEPADAIRWAFRRQRELGWSDDETVYVFDGSGIGQGVVHLFRDAGKRYHIFHTHGRAKNRKEYDDKLTEAFFHVSMLAKTREMALLDDGLLFSQLADRHYEMTAKDAKMKAESKKVYMKRTESNSPDRADGLVMAYYPHVGGRGKFTQGYD